MLGKCFSCGCAARMDGVTRVVDKTALSGSFRQSTGKRKPLLDRDTRL